MHKYVLSDHTKMEDGGSVCGVILCNRYEYDRGWLFSRARR